MQLHERGRCLWAAFVTVGLITSVSLAAQTGPETFTATASVKSSSTSASAPVTIRIDRFLSDAERAKVVAVARNNDVDATQKALAAMADIGFIQVGTRRTPIKYAYARSTGGGRLVTVVTSQPILHLGGSLPNAKPKEGFNLAIALLVLDANNTGDGELAPAAKVKANEAGAVVTDDYGAEVVRLTGVSKGKAPAGTGPR